MIVTLPPYEMLDGIADLFGWDGVKTYLELAQHGLELELDLASKLLPNPEQQVKQNGSLMVCEADRSERLRQEFDFLQKLDCTCEWWGEERVAAHGSSAGYVAGICSRRMHELILFLCEIPIRCCIKNRALTLRDQCSPVVDIQNDDSGRTLSSTSDGERLKQNK